MKYQAALLLLAVANDYGDVAEHLVGEAVDDVGMDDREGTFVGRWLSPSHTGKQPDGWTRVANFSPTMLRSNAEHAGMMGLFDALVSTDANHTYKPDPRAYQLGLDRLHVAKQDIVFAAFGGWDAAGAKSFGSPTVWVNRFDQPIEELGVRPDRTVRDLSGLLNFEQNVDARGFYEALGFNVVGRSPFDPTGRPYALLHMRREGPPRDILASAPQLGVQPAGASDTCVHDHQGQAKGSLAVTSDRARRGHTPCGSRAEVRSHRDDRT